METYIWIFILIIIIIVVLLVIYANKTKNDKLFIFENNTGGVANLQITDLKLNKAVVNTRLTNGQQFTFNHDGRLLNIIFANKDFAQCVVSKTNYSSDKSECFTIGSNLCSGEDTTSKLYQLVFVNQTSAVLGGVLYIYNNGKLINSYTIGLNPDFEFPLTLTNTQLNSNSQFIYVANQYLNGECSVKILGYTEGTLADHVKTTTGLDQIDMFIQDSSQCPTACTDTNPCALNLTFTAQ